MRAHRVTNRTQGRLELKTIRCILDAGESVVVVEPLSDEIKLKMGGGRLRLLDVVEVVLPAKKSPAPLKSSFETSLLPDSTEAPRKKRTQPE
jgi:hypothetical protein